MVPFHGFIQEENDRECRAEIYQAVIYVSAAAHRGTAEAVQDVL